MIASAIHSRKFLRGILSCAPFKRFSTSLLGNNSISADWNESDLTFFTGKIATLASGSCFCKAGDSVVLTTAVAEPIAISGNDFLPLTVEYRQKSYATGEIPRTHNGRDAMKDVDILHSRLIDRCIRPLFPVGFFNDTQIISTVHSNDGINDPSILAVNSASMALSLSDIPWDGPIGCVRIGYINNEFVMNPTMQQMKDSTLDLVYAANSTRTLMIEAEGHEVTEEIMTAALKLAHKKVQPIIASQLKLISLSSCTRKAKYSLFEPTQDMKDFAHSIGYDEALRFFTKGAVLKSERQAGEKQLMGSLVSRISEKFSSDDRLICSIAAHNVIQQAFRDRVLYCGDHLRCDTRNAKDVRAIGVDVDLLPVVHGSAFFSRGETQSFCNVTLGEVENRSGEIIPDDHKDFTLHYEFPPYCVNETGRLGGVNRRMIGHGALAEKALRPVIPLYKDFGFKIRVTSEITGSDGSSSMATVCGGTMALMDAGVPIKNPVAGISIGLITEGDPFDARKAIINYKLLTDILGTEDHYGDMDFKVAGTKKGITAIQLDVKLPGIPVDILCEGLHQSRQARFTLLDKMTACLPRFRNAKKDHAPHSEQMMVDVSMLRNLIGIDGENIRDIETESECSVKVSPLGEVRIFAPSKKHLEAAKTLVNRLTLEFEEGKVYTGKVTKILDFGAIIEVAPGRNGILHISEVSSEVGDVITDFLSLDSQVQVKCIGKADRYAKFSVKQLPRNLHLAKLKIDLQQEIQ